MKNNHTYKIKEHNADPMNAVIEKGGITAEFTLNDLEGERRSWQKMLEEYKSKRSLEQAKVENIEHFHPFVKELSDQDRLTAYLYGEARGVRDVCDKKIAEIEAEIAFSEKESKMIAKKLGLRSKEEAVKEAVEKITEPEHG